MSVLRKLGPGASAARFSPASPIKMASRAGLVAIACEGVSKSFELLENAAGWRVVLGFGRRGETFQALDEVSFDVPKGEFVGILGRNGAGKSTLLRVMGGIYHPDRGRVRLRGELSGLYEIGTAGNPELSGREYARRFLELGGARGAELRRLIADVQEFSELDERFDDCILTYSTGMAARLYFSVATAQQHEVYLIDEVLSVGDSHFQAKCWTRIRERLTNGASGVLVTHDWSAVIKLCRTAHILDNGRIVFSGSADKTVRRYLYGEGDGMPIKRGIARFEDNLPSAISWRSGEEARLVIPVRIHQSCPVSLRLSIERMNIGIGWEIALMSRYAAPVGDAPGLYAVAIVVPQLPLAAGHYTLNLFLTQEPSPDQPDRIALDLRGWLNGTGIALEVEGPPGPAMVRLPMRWELSAE